MSLLITTTLTAFTIITDAIIIDAAISHVKKVLPKKVVFKISIDKF